MEKRPLNEVLRNIMDESRRREAVIRQRMEWVEARRRHLWQRQEELEAALAGTPPHPRAPLPAPAPQVPEPATL